MDSKNLVGLIHKVGELKKVKRAGWLRHEIPEPESVADHTFRTAFLAMILGDGLGVDTLKLMKMALIHDLAEAVAGDITPFDGITREEKHGKEETVFREMLEGISGGQEYLKLWKEYEKQESKEAMILRNLDKLEMAIQAVEYEMAYPDKDLSEFILEADRRIINPEIHKIFEEARK